VTAYVQMQSTIGKSGGKLKEVHIVEEKVYVTLREEEDREPCRWVLDTGASNHMSGRSGGVL
jgi:protein involved in ribonucleotide reduction